MLILAFSAANAAASRAVPLKLETQQKHAIALSSAFAAVGVIAGAAMMGKNLRGVPVRKKVFAIGLAAFVTNVSFVLMNYGYERAYWVPPSANSTANANDTPIDWSTMLQILGFRFVGLTGASVTAGGAAIGITRVFRDMCGQPATTQLGAAGLAVLAVPAAWFYGMCGSIE